jgi:hypothetical protein
MYLLAVLDFEGLSTPTKLLDILANHYHFMKKKTWNGTYFI